MAAGLLQEADACWISKTVTENVLVDRMMWTASYNYLYPVLWCSALARVYESGMHDWWTAYRLSYYEKLDRATVQERIPSTFGKDDETKSDHEIPMQVYVQVFSYFGALVGMATLLFNLEIFCRYNGNTLRCKNLGRSTKKAVEIKIQPVKPETAREVETLNEELSTPIESS